MLKPNLEAFIDEYIAKRTDVKSGTKTVFERTKKHLVEYFGANKPIDEITEADADDWRLWLADKQKLAKNTIGRTCVHCKAILSAGGQAKTNRGKPIRRTIGAGWRQQRAPILHRSRKSRKGFGRLSQS
jgi:hypothetical protein